MIYNKKYIVWSLACGTELPKPWSLLCGESYQDVLCVCLTMLIKDTPQDGSLIAKRANLMIIGLELSLLSPLICREAGCQSLEVESVPSGQWFNQPMHWGLRTQKNGFRRVSGLVDVWRFRIKCCFWRGNESSPPFPHTLLCASLPSNYSWVLSFHDKLVIL